LVRSVFVLVLQLPHRLFERRRNMAMPMLNMKTKKPMKPMLETAETTEDAGLSSPCHPASAPTSRPSHPIHRGSTRVVRMDSSTDSASRHGRWPSIAPNSSLRHRLAVRGRHQQVYEARLRRDSPPGVAIRSWSYIASPTVTEQRTAASI
jgi:hypothetical protein